MSRSTFDGGIYDQARLIRAIEAYPGKTVGAIFQKVLGAANFVASNQARLIGAQSWLAQFPFTSDAVREVTFLPDADNVIILCQWQRTIPAHATKICTRLIGMLFGTWGTLDVWTLIGTEADEQGVHVQPAIGPSESDPKYTARPYLPENPMLAVISSELELAEDLELPAELTIQIAASFGEVVGVDRAQLRPELAIAWYEVNR